MVLMALELIALFRGAFQGNREEVGVASAPGRANLIGEHTDYQEGFVTPFALDGMRCWVAFARREDSVLRCYAADLDEYGECDLAEIAARRRADPGFGPREGDFEKSWLRYVGGAFEFVAAAVESDPRGCDVYVTSTVPWGAGLSSSSALTVASAIAAREVFKDKRLSKYSLLETACRAEWHYGGVPGGIMDQFASLHGREGRALVLDCRTQKVAKFVDLEGVDLLVLNTNVEHDLRDSPYAERREACERVARAAEVAHLRDLSDEGDDHSAG
ncbi:hypothetical protein CTAYLR_003466 [Chrysophaeum taylorii]|uniref:Galactokinase n=1 Tax=Chrysophaeum taylorii TaxID=2483200 RepID=A0AAD7U8C8_9STRA|nr:hypothetical protein CTAYLR_003466 [Chrysophaeum taylorii]